jgi:uncharacterized membrane protein YqiK
MFGKKGQGLPLNTIIIAIIVIVVLVVIILIFTGQLGDFGKAANACVQAGGYCTSGECDGRFQRKLAGEPDAACTGDETGGSTCCRGIPDANP